ncbi:MAG: hypothetical protein LBC61_05840 [Candidatus Peribacteria bacterium]|nr:hypothetical protein [Candidatus Peribacteria bacterium]
MLYTSHSSINFPITNGLNNVSAIVFGIQHSSIFRFGQTTITDLAE